MPQKTHDIIVVGGGAAGLTAALFAARRGHSVLVISQDIGGQAATTPDIENYPGLDLVEGLQLMEKFKRQAEHYGAEVKLDTVHSIEVLDNGRYKVSAHTSTVESEVVILAFGLSHRHLNVPGEKEYIGKGLSYCSICETNFYEGKDIAVVGGGSSAVQAAVTFSKDADHVTLVNINPEFRAEAILLEKMKHAHNITSLINTETKEVVGKDEITGLRVADKISGKETLLPVERVFVEIGYMAKADWIKHIVNTDERNQIIISDKCETSQPGIFACGDITTIAFKQIVISAGEGAKAALAADQYLLTRRGKRGVKIDWGRKK